MGYNPSNYRYRWPWNNTWYGISIWYIISMVWFYIPSIFMGGFLGEMGYNKPYLDKPYYIIIHGESIAEFIYGIPCSWISYLGDLRYHKPYFHKFMGYKNTMVMPP